MALKWLPAYFWQRVARPAIDTPFHLVIAVANHFEPYTVQSCPATFAPFELQLSRVKQWIEQYPKVFDRYRDTSGSPLKHTYFFPAEHYHPQILALLADHCHRGWGEVEIHRHHGMGLADTPENTKEALTSFRDTLVTHGCLCRLDDVGGPRYAFVHGNFALANSGGGRYCGVDSELQILAETGCYADFTLPSWPNRAQIQKINALYECESPLSRRAAHRSGRDLVIGVRPTLFPLIIQGPLMVDFGKRCRWLLPVIENSALTVRNPPSLRRLRLWIQASVTVRGRPNWAFVKLHCHGMDPRDTPALLGTPIVDFLSGLSELEKQGVFRTYFVTAREMANVLLAACDGRDGPPSEFKNYRLHLAF